LVDLSLLDASVRFAGIVSPEMVKTVALAMEKGDIQQVTGKLSGDAAQGFRDLQAAWANDSSKSSARDIALMLRGALHAVSRERELSRAELVWSGPSILSSPVRSTQPALLELLNSAKTSVYLVTFAAYKVPAVMAAIDAAVARGVRVVMVVENEEASAGKVSFDPLPYLHSRSNISVDVYVWPLAKRGRDEKGRHGTLHAKFAVADRNRLLVSSANLTEYAFELNIELGVLITGGQVPLQAAAHIESLIRMGVLQRHVA
jgi:cardiolipin synthase A/B